MPAVLTESLKETIQTAAAKLTGVRRREFQAEMVVKYCAGSPRRAERVFGWGRAAVRTGLNELRTGIRCVDNFSARGRRTTESKNPALVAQIHVIVEPESQADPKFQTPLAYTRITAKAVRQQLSARGAPQHLPAERTLRDILNRLGYRLRRVRKTKPKKSTRDRRDLRSPAASPHRSRRRPENSAYFTRYQGEGEGRRLFTRRRGTRAAKPQRLRS